MAKTAKQQKDNLLKQLVRDTYLFKGLDETWLAEYLPSARVKVEKLFSNRPVYTAFLPDRSLDVLYVILDEGLVITRSTPLDRIIAINYPGSCFGMRSLPFSYGLATTAFPCLVEAYKTTHALEIPLETVQKIYEDSETFRDRYKMLFELGEKFQYHLLNCGTYPPQAVASLLRALIYQERELGNQPDTNGIYTFDLPVDVIARACQLNQRTVEQVLKGMQQVGLLGTTKGEEASGDLIKVISPEGLKEVYSATREKVSWWPLR
ncbi:Crp/Fnr family transcriptional regulator [Candidatus Gracilibacteria bacterium]|nr:Crp/Fnr family transcriptional regulator [Candidatus Gracilibacteria bacterium]